MRAQLLVQPRSRSISLPTNEPPKASRCSPVNGPLDRVRRDRLASLASSVAGRQEPRIATISRYCRIALHRQNALTITLDDRSSVSESIAVHPLYASSRRNQQTPTSAVALAPRQNTLTGLRVADFISRTRDDPEIWRFAAGRHPHGSGGTFVGDAIRGSAMRSFFASQDLAKQRLNSTRFAVRRSSCLTRRTSIQNTLLIAVQVLPARAARQYLKFDHSAVGRGACLARGAGIGNTPIVAVEVLVRRTAALATGQRHHPRRAV